jgi:hypothetical protein
VVRGGRRLAKKRHNLRPAGLTPATWRPLWDAERAFLTADGESGKKYGNETIRLTPQGQLVVKLPAPLAHLAPRGRLVLSQTAAFSHRAEDLLDRIAAHRAVRYDIWHNPLKDRWYLDASWGQTSNEVTLEQALAGDVLAVDLNDGHLAACVVDPSGNRVGDPITVPVTLKGLPASIRDGHLRAAVAT